MPYSHLAGFGASMMANDRYSNKVIPNYVKPLPARNQVIREQPFLRRMRADMRKRQVKQGEYQVIRRRRELGMPDRRKQAVQRQGALVIRTFAKDQWSTNQREHEWGPLGF